MPYRGGAPAIADVAAGQIDIFFANISEIVGQITSGQVRAFGIAAAAPNPDFGPRGATAPASAPEIAAAADEEVSRPTRDTIKALEQARQKIEQAFETRSELPAATEAVAEVRPEAEVEAEVEAEAESEDAVVEEETVAEDEVMDDGQLYVVEERVIRRHPARILSDGTVEAETAEGWMRFENLEHLDEYLDAMEQART